MLEREALERMAIEAVDASLYYDLMDYLEITSDEELLEIVEKYKEN